MCGNVLVECHDLTISANGPAFCDNDGREMLLKKRGSQAADVNKLSNLVPPLSKFEARRTSVDFYRRFCKTFLKCVVGDRVWRSNWLKVPLSEFVSVTDEAFALLVIDNCHERWTKMFVSQNTEEEGEDEGGEEGQDLSDESSTPGKDGKWPDPKYTNGGKNSNNGRTRKFCGWSSQGVKKFNQLCWLVMSDRKKASNKTWDADTMEAWKKEHSPEDAKGDNDKENEPRGEPIMPFTDFQWDMEKVEEGGVDEPLGGLQLKPRVVMAQDHEEVKMAQGNGGEVGDSDDETEVGGDLEREPTHADNVWM